MKKLLVLSIFLWSLVICVAQADNQIVPILTQIKVSGESANDEFIEIFNPTDEDYLLADLSLIKETSSGRKYTLYKFSTETILANGFFLLAHEESIFSDNADAVYSTSLANNNKLILMDNENTLVDEVQWQTIDPDHSLQKEWDEDAQSWNDWSLSEFVQARNSQTTWPPEPDFPVTISEVMITPHNSDIQWIELYNDSDETIDLQDYYFVNSNVETILIDGLINAQQHRLIPLDDSFVLSLQDTIAFLNYFDEPVDQWEFDIDHELGQSLIVIDDELVTTNLSTGGRENVLKEEELVECGGSEQGSVIGEEGEASDEDDNEEASGEEIGDSGEEGEEREQNEQREMETGNIIISEVFANPEGDEGTQEFIELYNTDDHEIYLDGWIIADATKQYIVSDLSIETDNYIVLSRPTTSIALNNSNETVTLIDPFGDVIQEMSYQTTTEGLSLNYQPVDVWYEGEPSMGGENSDQISVINDEGEEEEGEGEREKGEEEIGGSDEGSVMSDEDGSEERGGEEIDNNSTPDPNLDQIRLNEILPNPVGSDDQEWIELYNPTDHIINLAGLILADKTSQYIMDAGLIGPKEYLKIDRANSSIALNNSAEEISLMIDDDKIDSCSYESSKEGFSLALDENDEWLQTSILTPGEKNAFDPQETSESSASYSISSTSPTKTAASTQKTSSADPATVLLITLDQWAKVEDDENVNVTGQISILPGVLQKRNAFIQTIIDETPYALELYFHKAEWPDLEEGDVVEVKGEKSVTQNGARLLIRATEDIVVKGKDDLPVFVIDENDEIDKTLLNVLVEVSGSLIEHSTKELVIDVNENETIIDTSKLKIDEIPSDSKVVVTGIVRKVKNEYVITPRSPDDIEHELIEPEIIEQIVEPNVEQISSPVIDSKNDTNYIALILSVLLGASFTSLVFLIIIFRKNITNHLLSLIQKQYEKQEQSIK